LLALEWDAGLVTRNHCRSFARSTTTSSTFSSFSQSRCEVALGTLAAAGCRDLPSLDFSFRKLRLATASLQYQNGPARVLLRHLEPEHHLVGQAVTQPEYANGRDSGAERSEVSTRVDDDSEVES
jgi:hypothetical protein